MKTSNAQILSQAYEALKQGRLADAEKGFKKFLRSETRHAGALNLYGILLIQTHRFAEAEPVLRKAISIDATSDVTFYNYGLILKNLGKHSEGLEALTKSIAITGTPEAFNNRGTVFNDLARYDEALGDFEKAISLAPNYAEAYSNKGKSLLSAHRHDEAASTFQRALQIKPDLWEAWIGYGNILIHQRQIDDAIKAFDKALKINPKSAHAWCGRGEIFDAQYRMQEALTAFDQALQLKQDFAEAWLGKAKMLSVLGRHNLAAVAFRAALAINAHIKYAKGGLFHGKAHVCDWDGIADGFSDCITDMNKGLLPMMPFMALSCDTSPAEQLAYGKVYADDTVLKVDTPLWRGERYSHDKIRIAYLSADFHDHATSHLMAGLFEKHNKSRFETTAVSYGIRDTGAMRRRLEAAFDHFIDVRDQSDIATAQQLRDMEIDIVIDLKGYTQEARTAILSHRPAPVQVNYLGYPSTMGVDFIDYIVGDGVIMPTGDDQFYSEKIVRLPDTYQPNDSVRVISKRTPTRAEAGLPEQGFVFCSFNNNYKITPSIFDIWMRLLSGVPDSVLWLYVSNDDVPRNLRREAEARGVAADQLVFAKRMDAADHLARLRLADLFLDTLPYNAHTTASDALWAGLPVLTCTGSTFAGRVAASLLNAVGLPELVTESLEEYEALALKLARDPVLLSVIRAKLASNRDTYPLFDTARYTRHLESAFVAMWERAQRGEAPAAITISPD